jgi:hypothetical protein
MCVHAFSCFGVSNHSPLQMAVKVGGHLRHEWFKLRFTRASTIDTTGEQLIRPNVDIDLSTASGSLTIFYERLDMSIFEYETKRMTRVEVTWTGVRNRPEIKHAYTISKMSTVDDLRRRLTITVLLTPGGSGEIRFFRVGQDGREHVEVPGGTTIEDLPAGRIYAEVRSLRNVTQTSNDMCRRRSRVRRPKKAIATRWSMSSITHNKSPGHMAYHSSFYSSLCVPIVHSFFRPVC